MNTQNRVRTEPGKMLLLNASLTESANRVPPRDAASVIALIYIRSCSCQSERRKITSFGRGLQAIDFANW